MNALLSLLKPLMIVTVLWYAAVPVFEASVQQLQQSGVTTGVSASESGEFATEVLQREQSNYYSGFSKLSFGNSLAPATAR